LELARICHQRYERAHLNFCISQLIPILSIDDDVM
jgi:hypothetical protein